MDGIWFYLLTVALILLTTILLLLKKRLTYWKRKGVDTFQPKLFFGNVQNVVLQKERMADNIKKFYDEMKSKGKKYGGYYFLFRPVFVPIDLDVIKNMLIGDFEHFTDHISHVDEERDPLSMHIFNQKGGRWRNLRNKLSPAFTPGKLKMMFDTIHQATNELVLLTDKAALNHEPIDVKDISQRYTIDNIVSCAFGIECNSLKDPNVNFVKHKNQVVGTNFKQSIYLLLIAAFPEFFSIFKMRSFEKRLSDFFINLVSKTVQQREEHNIIRKDFMHLLLQIRNNVQITESNLGNVKNANDGGDVKLSLNINELAAQCFVFFLAGFETTATTITFCLFELSLNHSLQEKAREEINATFEKYGSFTYDAMMEMTYLENCIYETLRKYPPLPFTTRVCTKTYKIPNTDVVINKGMHVYIPVYGIQMDPEYFPNPELFDPDRFAEGSNRKQHSCAWLPFGQGPRICPGFRFGVMEVKLFVAVLLQSYTFSVRPETKLPLKFDTKGYVPAAASTMLLAVEKL